ncbi:hypothetical protein CP082626L3_0404B, partial [Chlamydia psittaci 08-2626_L3]
VFNLRAL